MNIKKIRRISLAVLASAVLAACGTSGTMVRANGTADELHWPNPVSTTFNKDRGTFPNWENLKQIRSGMSKDQLYDLLVDHNLMRAFVCVNGIIYFTSIRPIKVQKV